MNGLMANRSQTFYGATSGGLHIAEGGFFEFCVTGVRSPKKMEGVQQLVELTNVSSPSHVPVFALAKYNFPIFRVGRVRFAIFQNVTRETQKKFRLRAHPSHFTLVKSESIANNGRDDGNPLSSRFCQTRKTARLKI